MTLAEYALHQYKEKVKQQMGGGNNSLIKTEDNDQQQQQSLEPNNNSNTDHSLPNRQLSENSTR